MAGIFRDATDVEEGSWSEDKRLPLAGGRDVLVTPPWCFMCPWELAEFRQFDLFYDAFNKFKWVK